MIEAVTLMTPAQICEMSEDPNQSLAFWLIQIALQLAEMNKRAENERLRRSA